MMEESLYNQRVAGAFKRLLKALDAVDPDLLDADSTSDMVTITSAKGQKCIVNTQRAVRQIWVAGMGQGIHFNFEEGSGLWKDDKGRGIELFGFVSDAAKDMAGVELNFDAD
jgi:CyaY protein